MHVNVIVCTWNRCELLRQCLEHMTRLSIPDGVAWDVTVVNNNSTDATDDVLASFAQRLPLRRLFEERPGKSHALNRALDEARGTHILWTDDDALVDEGWLDAFVRCARRYPAADLFGGPIEAFFPVAPDPTFASAFPEVRTGFCGLDHDAAEGPLDGERIVHGVNMGCRIGAVTDLRFKPQLGPKERSGRVGEEKEFAKRVRERGGSVIWCPTMKVRHYVDPERMTLESLRRFYYGRGQTLVRESENDPSPRLLGVPRWIWRGLIQEWVAFNVLRVTPFRVSAMTSLREYCRLRGMANESRARLPQERFAWLDERSPAVPQGYLAVTVRLDAQPRLARLIAWLTMPWRIRSAERRIRRAGGTPVGRYGAWPDAHSPTVVYALDSAAATYAEAELLPAPPRALRWLWASQALAVCHPSLGAIIVLGKPS